jgi:hypothetical protein
MTPSFDDPERQVLSGNGVKPPFIYKVGSKGPGDHFVGHSGMSAPNANPVKRPLVYAAMPR